MTMAAGTQLQQKLKYLRELERKFRLFLLNGENQKAVDLLLQIIEGYRGIGAIETVKNLENEMKHLLKRFNLTFSTSEGSKASDLQTKTDSEQILKQISALEKKVKRRLLQGKLNEAIRDLEFIITKLRELKQFERANLLEDTLNEYIIELSGKSEARKPDKPIRPQIRPVKLPSPPKPISKTPPESPPPKITLLPPIPDLQIPPNTVPYTIPPPPKPISQAPLPISSHRAIPPPPLPSSSASEVAPPVKKSSTIKDEPLSEEELIVQKLFEIKDMLSKKSS